MQTLSYYEGTNLLTTFQNLSKKSWPLRTLPVALTLPNWLILLLCFPLIAALAWPAVQPLLTQGFPVNSDGQLHLLRLNVLDFHIRQGMLYPRWLPELFLGYGYPDLNFYGPFIYYFAEALHLAGLPQTQAFLDTLVVYVILGGWGTFLVAVDLYPSLENKLNPWSALIAALAYIYTPYLLTNIYIRGACAELAAQAFLPWIFWSFGRLFTARQRSFYALGAAFSLAGLAITHNITLLLLPPVLLGYLLIRLVQVWRTGEDWRTPLLWCSASGLAAMSATTFFWLPLIVERNALVSVVYPALHWQAQVWNWQNFVQVQWPYNYNIAVPFRLGIVQLTVALAGILLIKRRPLGWWYWVGLAGLSMMLISQLAMQVWLRLLLLHIVQFPWRLLTFVGLALALLTGGVVTRLRPFPWQLLATICIVALLIFGNRPISGSYALPLVEDTRVDLESEARFERDEHALGTGWIAEFLPRWAEGTRLETLLAPLTTAQINLPGVKIVPQAASPHTFAATVTTSTATPLHLNQFYFPGWQVTLDETTALVSYPSAQGLLTVDLPAGTHALRVAWQGTFVQRLANSLSILGLLSFALWLWFRRTQRLSVIVPLFFALLGGFILFKPAPAALAIQRPAQQEPEAATTLELLGYQTRPLDAQTLLLTPYWYVKAPTPETVFLWQLVDQAGVVQSETRAAPYYNTLRTDAWQPGLLVRDAYLLRLPAGLTAGHYTLQLQRLAVESSGNNAANSQVLGTVTIPALVTGLNPRLWIRFMGPDGFNSAWLDDYSLAINGTPVAGVGAEATPSQYPVARPGEHVNFILYWRAAGPLTEDFHSFVHLVDSSRQVAIAHDQLPGSRLNPPHLWNQYTTQRDTYKLELPANLPSGLYFPNVGLYRYGDRLLLKTQTREGTVLGDSYDLPPIKVVNSPSARPQHKVAASFANLANFLGYDLAPPATTLKPGDTFTVTLYYQATTPTATDYTRFVHLYNPVLGMAAQFDSPPQQGANPTSAWVQNEVIADPVVLQIAPDAKSGSYQLQVGLYEANSTRLSVHNSSGKPLPDAQIKLTELEVTP